MLMEHFPVKIGVFPYGQVHGYFHKMACTWKVFRGEMIALLQYLGQVHDMKPNSRF